eukprot:105300-Rhodomonas_salina.3
MPPTTQIGFEWVGVVDSDRAQEEEESLVGDVFEKLKHGRNKSARKTLDTAHKAFAPASFSCSSDSSCSLKAKAILKAGSETGRNSAHRVWFSLHENPVPARHSSAWDTQEIAARPCLINRILFWLSSPSPSSPLPRRREGLSQREETEVGEREKRLRVWHLAAFMLGFLHPALILLFFIIAVSVWSPLSDKLRSEAS